MKEIAGEGEQGRWFQGDVYGPWDCGGTMCNFMEFRDAEGHLYTPPVRVACYAPDGAFLAFVYPGDKGEGKCEFCPLIGNDVRYGFQVEDLEGHPLSEMVFCDLSLPFVELSRTKGQYHKSFITTWTEATPPPPATEDKYKKALQSIYEIARSALEN